MGQYRIVNKPYNAYYQQNKSEPKGKLWGTYHATCKAHWQAPASPHTAKYLPISFPSFLRTLPLMAALELPTHKINWFFVTYFIGMTKGLITKDSARYENEYL